MGIGCASDAHLIVFYLEERGEDTLITQCNSFETSEKNVRNSL